MTLRVLIITGTREGIPHNTSWGIEKLQQLEAEIANADLVIHGGAEGVDRQAARIATRLNVHSAAVAALWKTRGKNGGPDRNTMLADIGALLQQAGADVRYAAVPGSRSSGTWDCERKLKGRAIKGRCY